MTEPFGRSAMYAFVSDIIRNTQGRNGFSFRVASLFRNQVVKLVESGIVDYVLRGGTAKSSLVLQRRNVVIKVLLAAASKYSNESCIPGSIFVTLTYISLILMLPYLRF